MVTCGTATGFIPNSSFTGTSQLASKQKRLEVRPPFHYPLSLSKKLTMISQGIQLPSFNKTTWERLVTAVGRHIYSKRHRKPSKYPDIRKSCMRDMRRLGAMVLAFQSATSDDHKNVEPKDILDRRFFPYIETAVTALSKEEKGDLKAGTKLGLGYILRKTAKVMKVEYLIADNDSKAKL